MILANVAAAEELERLSRPCMYRVHAPPSPEKIQNLRNFLSTLDISLQPGDQLHPRDLDKVLKLVEGTDKAMLVNETVLRSQSQAEYSAENIGHFGLALTRYAHFTSPIRRYADLLVHRALISGLKLGKDGLSDDDAARFEDSAEHITATERRATLAERDSTDRYLALYLQHRVGELFEGRISGVTKFGLFVTLPETGASGFAPMATLPDDFWVHDEASQSLIGKRTRLSFQLAQTIEVRLAEARPVTGGLIFNVITGAQPNPVRRFSPEKSRKPHPGEARHPQIHADQIQAEKTTVNRAALLLFICIILPAGSLSQPAAASNAFGAATAASVWAAALTYIVPRSLQPLTVPQMTVWGLQGLTALDPDLTATLQDGQIRLYGPDQLLIAVPAPPPTDINAWGAAAAQVASAGYAASPALQQAGTQGLISSFFDELFNHFDPYSRYEPPLQAAQDQLMITGIAGAGLTLARQGGSVVVASVAPDSPASEAGLSEGTLVLAVDGRPAYASEVSSLNDNLNGILGSTVTLRVEDPGDPSSLTDVVLTRAFVPPQTVFPEAFSDSPAPQNFLALKITGFNKGTSDQFSAALVAGLSGDPAPAGLVIDLRGNRGGILRQAILAADTLLPSGVIVLASGRDPDADQRFTAEGSDLTTGLPIVVLVDGQTASAAEILAAALSDNRRAVVVGSSTLGKGLVQAVTSLPDGGELFITWSRVLAPRGWPLQSLGVIPQVCTSLGQQSLAAQLAALQSGRNLMASADAQARAARAPVPIDQILAIRNACPRRHRHQCGHCRRPLPNRLASRLPSRLAAAGCSINLKRA